jgi:hypothetical protein
MLKTVVELLDRDPLGPFRIVLTSGDRYEVSNPHLLAIGQTEMFYCWPRSDRFSFIRLNQIAAIDMLDSAA